MTVSEVEAHERKQQAKARWKILRSALLGEATCSTTKQASIHNFEGFRMLHRRHVGEEEFVPEYAAKLRIISLPSDNKEVILDQLETKIKALSHCYALWKMTGKDSITVFQVSNSDFLDAIVPFLQQGLADRGIVLEIEPLKEENHNNLNADLSDFQCFARFKPPYPTETPCMKHACIEYKIPFGSNKSIRIRTRERIQNDTAKADLKALTSHHHYGVDNTGNARVWDSESTLTYCLTTSCRGESTIFSAVGSPNLLAQTSQSQILQVVELGAGMAGLAGLTLGAIGLASTCPDLRVNVLLTDGHPDSVENNVINAHLTAALYPNENQFDNIRSSRLLWKDSKEGATECAALLSGSRADLCLASDCTHFQEFHAALMMTIARLLRLNGVAVLCQPHRGNSLSRFMELLEAVNQNSASPLWRICLLEDYDETVSLRHKQFLEKDSFYDPSIHYPLLLILRKLRNLEEDTDRCLANKHMEKRDAPC